MRPDNAGKKCTMIILAAGSGSRMQSNVAKQFMLLRDKPLIWYSLNAAQDSPLVDECILVTGEAQIDYVKKEIVDRYGFTKVRAVIAGGSERYASVANAMRYLAESGEREGIIMVHDGARPFLTDEIIERCYEGADLYRACVAAMPSKDTVKIVDEDRMAVDTPDRKYVWAIQTPQAFDAGLIVSAYAALDREVAKTGSARVTDDAGVVERFTDVRVKMVEGSYTNLKITTPEDLKIAEIFLAEK